MSLFLVEGQREYSYAKLWSGILHADDSEGPIVERGGTFQTFVRLLAALYRERDVELLDGSLSDGELATLDGGPRVAKSPARPGPARFDTWSGFLHALRRKDIGGSISLYTSGTTGRPKKVSHRFSSISRAVRVGARHREDVWALAYNPTHMAGLQVLLQAVLNENSLVCVFGLEQEGFEEFYERYAINRISATPTYYRNLLMLFSRTFPGVKSVTTGGEKSSEILRRDLQRAFPNARIRNSYASTEAGSLLESEGDAFRIPEEYGDSMKIGEDGELLIHERLLGDSESFTFADHWFHTGDLVERIDGEAFRFKARTCALINVGGDKVDPEEIEAMIAAMPGVADVRVFGIKNSVTGEIVAADVVPARGAAGAPALRAAIRASLKGVIQPYKVPAIISVVESIEKTKTGKKVRQ